ncbi:MAG: amidohydrolase family protein [Pseudomonadota bacterium]
MKSIASVAALTATVFSLPTHAETTYLTAARMIDPVSRSVVENPALLIEDGKVVASATTAVLTVPAGTPTIDLGDWTILPGFIDMHTHLTGSATKGRGWAGLGLQKERQVIWGVANAEKTLMAGFTTVRNTGAEGYETVALRDAINEGEIAGPRMFVAGPPVGIVGGHCSDNNLLPPEYEASGEGVATGPWEMRAKVRQNIKYGVDFIKTCSTGGVFSKGTVVGAAQSTVEELRAIVDEAHMRGLKVASHAHGTIGIKNAITAGVDTIEHASFLDDEAIRMAKREGVYLSMDIYNTEFTLAEGERLGVRQEAIDKERSLSVEQRDSFTRAVRAGAKVVFGSDAAVYPHGDNPKQFSRMVEFGMTPMQAIVAATSLAAEALGKDGRLGCLGVSCAADIVAVEGDPLEDISVLESVDFVMKEGVVFKAP